MDQLPERKIGEVGDQFQRPPLKAGAPPAPTGPRPSLMELEGQPWHSRFRVRGGPSVATVLAHDPPPALVQFEPGHFVAVEE